MSIILKTRFMSSTHNIKFQPQTMTQGKLLVSAGQVRDVEEFKTKQREISIIQTRIIRQISITLTPYKTCLKLNTARVITSVICDCVYNHSGKCNYIAALIHYINNEENNSKTCQEQQWGKPSAGQFSKGRYFDEMFLTKLERTYEPMSIDLSDLVEHSALRSVIEAESQTEDTFIIKDVLEMLIEHAKSNLPC